MGLFHYFQKKELVPLSKSVGAAGAEMCAGGASVEVVIKTCVARDDSGDDIAVSDVSFTKDLSVGHIISSIIPSQRGCASKH